MLLRSPLMVARLCGGDGVSGCCSTYSLTVFIAVLTSWARGMGQKHGEFEKNVRQETPSMSCVARCRPPWRLAIVHKSQAANAGRSGRDGIQIRIVGRVRKRGH